MIDGKTLHEWSKDSALGVYTTLLNGWKKMGIHPSEIKSYRSLLEVKVKKFLEEIDVPFIHDEKLPEHEGMKKGFLRPDFLLKEHGLIIECDGEYWHQNKEKDEKRNNTYSEFGYKVLCFSGQEIVNNFPVVKAIILSELGPTF